MDAKWHSKLDAIQFGPHANLVANQIVSGLDFTSKQNSFIKRGCRWRICHRSRNRVQKWKL